MKGIAYVSVPTFLRRLAVCATTLLSITLAIALAVPSAALAQSTETVLYNFPGGTNGQTPAGLIFDASGNLYGATQGGGAHGFGNIFKLSPASGGGWTETVLYSFVGGAGVVYKLSPSSGGWKETVLHAFVDGVQDGGLPAAGLVWDAAGNLYGATTGGGSYIVCLNGSGCGVLFELSPPAPMAPGPKFCSTVSPAETGTIPWARRCLIPRGISTARQAAVPLASIPLMSFHPVLADGFSTLSFSSTVATKVPVLDSVSFSILPAISTARVRLAAPATRAIA